MKTLRSTSMYANEEKPKSILQQVEEMMPEEKIRIKGNNFPIHNGNILGYNQALSDIKSTLPKIFEMIADEITKLSEDCEYTDIKFFNKQIQDLLKTK